MLLSTAKSRPVALFKPKIDFIIGAGYNSESTSKRRADCFIDTIKSFTNDLSDACFHLLLINSFMSFATYIYRK